MRTFVAGLRMASFVVMVKFLVLCCLVWAVSAQDNCSTTFTNTLGVPRTFAICVNLGQQSASLAWTYTPQNSTLDLAFSGVLPNANGWVGWGLNPSPGIMMGTSALIAFSAANGSNVLTYSLTQDTQSAIPPSCSPIDLVVVNQSLSVHISYPYATIFATLQLQPNKTTFNQLWNHGSAVNDFKPQVHDLTTNGLSSLGTLDISTGILTVTSPPHLTLKNQHGVISAVSWGVLIPLGVMAARYMRQFESLNPTWFYLHIALQSSGYIIGVAGWSLGLKLQSYSYNVNYKHRNIGVAIFVFATLQVLALLLRPNPKHKFRKYWNVYHAIFGFTTLILAIVNIFEGFNILKPSIKWKHAYIVIVAALGAISLVLEILTWALLLSRRRRTPPIGFQDGGGRSPHTPNSSKVSNGISDFGNGHYDDHHQSL